MELNCVGIWELYKIRIKFSKVVIISGFLKVFFNLVDIVLLLLLKVLNVIGNMIMLIVRVQILIVIVLLLVLKINGNMVELMKGIEGLVIDIVCRMVMGVLFV